MIKRAFAVLLALLMCVAAVGCSSDGAPSGMYLASREGEPFKLYVPDAWTSNTVSGISGAFLSATDNVAVSARYTEMSEDITAEDYIRRALEDYAKNLSGYIHRQTSDVVLSGKNADLVRYSMVENEVEYTFCDYIVKHAGGFVTLSFHLPTSLYDTHSSSITTIVEAFVLCDISATQAEVVTDKNTPEGMKIASSEVVEYRFYVPDSWVCDPSDGRSDAYLDIAGRPNVSVTSFSPDTVISAEQYFEMAQSEYQKSIQGYELISTADRTVAEREAKVYVYTASNGDVNMRIMQTVFVYSQMVYSVTYTALESDFDAHLSDVGSMLDAFRFR